MKKEEKFLTATLVAALTSAGTLFVAMMYASGQAFRSGYLDAYGLYEALMPWTPQQMMFFGFQQSAYKDFLLLVGFGVYLGLVYALVTAAEHLGRRAAAKRKNLTVDTDNYFRSVAERKFSPMIVTAGILLAAAAFVLVLWAFISAEAAQGRQIALDERTSIDRLQCIGKVGQGMAYARISRSVGAGKPQTIEGYVVTCDSHACALYPGAPSAQQVSVVTLDNLLSFTTWIPSSHCAPHSPLSN
ncbi:hypothetical protein [Paraburkholderia hospita]|uniref:Uncharacterized protein n=1 Tax=Paraburkholderia hospita TaxID=169430 RepID=A0AAN1J5D7_9BURK|nr:hypothetical protein [Paraburkholderia hospita]AUT67023.1 hypothetical protein C2L64_00700 [Paraburkholderia hospita]